LNGNGQKAADKLAKANQNQSKKKVTEQSTETNTQAKRKVSRIYNPV